MTNVYLVADGQHFWVIIWDSETQTLSVIKECARKGTDKRTTILEAFWFALQMLQQRARFTLPVKFLVPRRTIKKLSELPDYFHEEFKQLRGQFFEPSDWVLGHYRLWFSKTGKYIRQLKNFAKGRRRIAFQKHVEYDPLCP